MGIADLLRRSVDLWAGEPGTAPLRHAEGREVCEAVLCAPEASDDDRRLARFNLSWYAQPLRTLCPSFSSREIEIPLEDAGWSRFNPTVGVEGDRLRAIVRSSNYTMAGGGFALVGDAPAGSGIPVTRSENYWVDLTPEGRAVSSRKMATPDVPVRHGQILGFEDLRLFREGGAWRAIGSASCLDADGLSRMVLLEIAGGDVVSWQALDRPVPGRAEKNWTPLLDGRGEFVYSLDPLVTAAHVGAGKVETATHSEGAPLFSDVRGGSPWAEVAVRAERRWLGLTHEVAGFSDTPRVYLHRFVLLARDGGGRLRIDAFSPAFFLRDRQVEFAAGLVALGGAGAPLEPGHEPTEVVLSYGLRDARAFVGRVAWPEVRALLRLR